MPRLYWAQICTFPVRFLLSTAVSQYLRTSILCILLGYVIKFVPPNLKEHRGTTAFGRPQYPIQSPDTQNLPGLSQGSLSPRGWRVTSTVGQWEIVSGAPYRQGGVTTWSMGLILECGEEHLEMFRLTGLGEEPKSGKGKGSRWFGKE